jgi:hypothetical protein
VTAEGAKNYDALPNPLSIYFGDFVPLIVERLTSSWVATDLDLHIDLVQIIGHMCKKSERHHLTSQWLRILQHLLAVITLISHIAQRKPAPQTRPETASGFAMIADLAGTCVLACLPSSITDLCRNSIQPRRRPKAACSGRSRVRASTPNSTRSCLARSPLR